MSDVRAAAKVMGWMAYQFTVIQPFLPIFFALLSGALYPVFTGAHASLSRPTSAAKPQRKKSADENLSEDDDVAWEEEEDSVTSKKAGLEPADALWFPLLGGVLLGGLYLLLKWIEDPTLLNKILNWHFSVMGVGTVGKLLADSISVTASMIFPQRWSNGMTIWHAKDGDEKYTMESGGAGHIDGPNTTRSSPFPGWLSILPIPVSIRRSIWSLRHALVGRYVLRVAVREKLLCRVRFGLNDVLGYVASLAVSIVYIFAGQPWWLMNLFAFGSSYTLLQLITPRTFWTGTMVLGSLFLYDIYMVFFTQVITILSAQSLDIPIKLVFPRSIGPTDDPGKQGFAMLGLGDVVLPGMIIALALRFDLYNFYLRKQTKRRSLRATVSDDENDQMVQRPIEVVKAPYRSATGRWGERFWTGSRRGGRDMTQTEPGTFPKPYFYASLVGYVAGMLITFGVLAFTKHAQPALLYLVPGVLSAVWGTALAKGELRSMWDFAEDSDEEGVATLGTDIPSKSKVTEKPSKLKDGINKATDNDDRASGTTTTTDDKFFSRHREQRILTVTITSRAPSRTSTSSISPSIVKDIREALDGDLTLRSTPGLSQHTSHLAGHRKQSDSVADKSPAEKRLRIE